MFIEGLPFEGGYREADGFCEFSPRRSGLQGDSSHIEGHQAGIHIGVERLGKPGLAVGQSSELLRARSLVEQLSPELLQNALEPNRTIWR
jgi:hypothetical protein